MNASRGLRAMLLAQGAEPRRRYPETLVVGWRGKVPPLALCAAAMGVYFVALMILDISPAKIVSGIGRLFDIVELMLPPDPESDGLAKRPEVEQNSCRRHPDLGG